MKIKKLLVSMLVAAVAVCTLVAFAACGDGEKETSKTYTASFTSDEVKANNGLYPEFTAAKADEFGLIQEDKLVLNSDGTYEFTKTLKSTKRSESVAEDMWKPIVVTYVFTGKYVQRENLVNLNAAESAIGDVDWGLLGEQVPGFFVSGKFTSGETTSERESDETILDMFPGAYLDTSTTNIAFQVTVSDDGSITF